MTETERLLLLPRLRRLQEALDRYERAPKQDNPWPQIQALADAARAVLTAAVIPARNPTDKFRLRRYRREGR